MSNGYTFSLESSRDAFQSLESVVNAVNAISNMLNSTHSAIFNSFRAVIGVVDQFRLLKNQVNISFLTRFVPKKNIMQCPEIMSVGLSGPIQNGQKIKEKGY